MTKLLVIIGVTGNQGNSVAQRFLQDPNYKVRGLTRNPPSTASQSLSAQGVEIVKADLDDVTSLISAFQGANLIFSVTNYWEPFFRPDSRQQAQERGISCRKYAYEVEFQRGKNIADAAAHPSVISGLDANGFIASTLSHAWKCSDGNFKEVYHHDAKADVFPYYVRERYGEEGGLAGKISCVMTGYFTSSYKLAMKSYLGKVCFSFFAFVPGANIFAYGAKVPENLATYKAMAGIECPMTSLEEWIRKEDWTAVFEQ
ncbi:hypothetical protein SS1G_14132 [Sclerotinia sclerotiorum 1980 UF-70]|uniref:NmrA-like domain-containing protein n=1 Tax=Sclerotinia sclerotiorum (strain ATCC 18683 / 1980 / Ss-1) TaxID=665079 RepID=A7F951_SCLS1|nr:hypothetical protein SS1G_14132 [Sclerotinia sclerotiorum 1980 UF-70]EDO00262.1 hypothetical protein SS1G_14132 [Sclerotinia sclerotiorum 1980 UF-70]